MNFEIKDTNIRKIFDSRGNFSAEVTVILENASGTASAPAGASTGKTEVIAYPDNNIDNGIDFFYRHVKKALKGFNSINQEGLDRMLHEIDGTDNFSNLGGNIATAISIANAKAVSNALGIPMYRYVGGINYSMPRPIGNVIGGGKHSKNGTTIQEFLVSAQGKTVLDSIYYNILIHRRIGEILSGMFKNQSIGLGDEKAWTCDISDEDAIEIIKNASKDISSEYKIKVLNGVDFAADSFYDGNYYIYKNRKLTRDQQIDYAISISRDHGFYYIEDPLNDQDFDGFSEITSKVGDKSLIVGDDLYTTNPERIKKGIEKRSTNGVLIKVNQIGTLSDTARSVRIATEHGLKTVVSHRSGETTDDFIAHLAVAFGSPLIKTGTIGGERLAKLNELIRIEEELI
ncbi:phosphopyruvate hydratase [Picrophilus oshimae]|uniref:Enolase n=1 Tax=Picrophilus torridus (strain ATCC 700027 / DSM 9790 / JCM 10055 / NBRC 100828 / KAW 2/3) TaxID=1122961 RepID=ENO_PICTO|nr:enolase [Picrophilus oshimae]Q6KZN3.1 RecName: Full=Enolase; AltName: Full=2-phospho-D-glycerate hydro-lyase; AltName: Full=2-phosphoglycerate dehydratase [Picrophilus oshimae DSM 9789]AAT43819.1 enolase [Picrophilus oshimae DSM 9789]